MESDRMQTTEDSYPDDWNRVYERGRLIGAFPPIEGSNIFRGCSFHDCLLPYEWASQIEPTP